MTAPARQETLASVIIADRIDISDLIEIVDSIDAAVPDVVLKTLSDFLSHSSVQIKNREVVFSSRRRSHSSIAAIIQIIIFSANLPVINRYVDVFFWAEVSFSQGIQFSLVEI